MGKDHTAGHGRPSFVGGLKRFWARLLPLLKNPWTVRILFALLRLIHWVATKFDWF
jgi:hypothetical protein